MTVLQPGNCLSAADALARGAWEEARASFLAELSRQETAEAHEGVGLTAWWLDLSASVFESRERAYRLYLDRGDKRSAARVAVWLAWDYWAFRGESAVANGWLQRARRLLEDHPDTPERAWLDVREGSLCLFEEFDPDRAHALASEGVRVARAAGSVDLEMLGGAVQGLALVMSGAVAEGLRRLDEVNAAVVAGEMEDFVAIGLASCYMIAGCEHVRDYDRAVQWCARLQAFCAKWKLHPLSAVCRTQYASICLWRGTWLEAEQELRAAAGELETCRPAMASDAVVRLAELRRRQGRLVEAARMFDAAGSHPLALIGHAEIALDRGDARAAADLAERYLRRLPPQNRTDRSTGLELIVRALSAAGDLDGARTALAELSAIAALMTTRPLRAFASRAEGWVALAADRADEARRHLEDAVDHFLQSGAPFELAAARLGLARALGDAGRSEEAAAEAQRAIDLFTELKAEFHLAQARAFVDSLPRARERGVAATAPAGLTPREIDVLRLVADGLSNQAIAERLFVSEHTVHRHVANILNKLSVSSRAAAVAQAARRGVL
jgi:LuxR family maltose regulon positive regulatory protein